MSIDEQKLDGGNVNDVVRIATTVRRTLGSCSDSVHRLLIHLEKNNFDFSPRYLGIDEEGREILSYIEGEAGNDPLKEYMWSDAVLQIAAQRLREFHDLSRTFDFAKLAWEISAPMRSNEDVLCHNDFAPYNTVFSDNLPVGIIDFDVCGPGPRVWDIAYTLFTFVPLSNRWQRPDGSFAEYERQSDAHIRRKRVELFLASYDYPIKENVFLKVVERLEYLKSYITKKAHDGDESFLAMLAEGHHTHYQKQIEFIQSEYTYWM